MALNMNLIKKIIIILLNCIFLFSSSVAHAEPLSLTNTSTAGRFTILKKGNIATFDGVLFDPNATAVILTDKEHSKKEYELKLKYFLDKQKEDDKLEISNLNISLNYQKKTCNEVMEQKNKELEGIRDIALKSSDNTLWYIGGGVVAGILISIGTYFVYKKAEQW